MKRQLLIIVTLLFNVAVFAQVQPVVIYSFENQSLFGDTSGQIQTATSANYLFNPYNTGSQFDADTLFSINTPRGGGSHSLGFDSIQSWRMLNSINSGLSGTYNYWLKHDKELGYGAVCFTNGALINNSFDGLFLSGLNADNKVFWDVVYEAPGIGVNFQNVLSNTVLDTNWHMVTLAWQTSTLSLYIDGVLDISLTLPSQGIVLQGNANSLSYSLGFIRTLDNANGDRPTNFYEGLMDEIAVYNVTLTDVQVLELYNQCSQISLSNITQSNDTLSVVSNLAPQIQWRVCGSSNLIPNANGPLFIPTTSESYQAIIETGNCFVTSDCFNYITVGIENINDNMLNIYPNPATNTIIIETNEDDAVISIIDFLGKEVLNANSTGNKTIINTDKLTNGVYFANIIVKEHKAQKKFIINK